MKICTREQMREMDEQTIHGVGLAGAILMEIAGRAAAHTLHERVVSEHGGVPKTVAVWCGGGNNGGDGYVMARHLDSLGYDVDVVLLARPESITGDAWTNLEILRRLRPTILVLHDLIPDMSVDALAEYLPYYDVYVDALLGTGLVDEVRGNYRQVIRYINEARGLKFAVDIPSGLDANTGHPLGIAFHADYTCTFGMGKNGLFLESGRTYAGEVTVVDFGILPETQDQVGIQGELLVEEGLGELAFPRPLHAHKGTFGHVGVIAGSETMPGAANLACGAAIISGVGLTSLATRPSVRPVVGARHPEVMIHTWMPESGPLDAAAREALARFVERKTAVAIGPGIGREPLVRDILDILFTEGHAPVIVDADGLNVLAEHLELLDDTFCPVILTPHPGEMARLTRMPIEEGMRDPLNWAFGLAHETGSYVVLKFSTTVLCAPDGRYAINTTGNPGMATGGTGDVLTGLMAGLLASGMTPWDAARLAVFAHGRAGDLAEEVTGQRALTAGSLLDMIPRALAFLE